MSTTMTTLQAQPSSVIDASKPFMIQTSKCLNPDSATKRTGSYLCQVSAPFSPTTDIRASLLNIPSSNATDSLASALSTFPSPPHTIANQLQQQNSRNHDAHKGPQRPSSYGSSSNASEDTLVPASPLQCGASHESSSQSSGPPIYDGHENAGEALEIDPALTATAPMAISHFSSHLTQASLPSIASSVHPDLPVPVSMHKTGGDADDADDFEAILSCLDLGKHLKAQTTRATTQHGPNSASSNRLPTSMHRFESALSCFRLVALELVQQLELHLDGSHSKLDDLLLSSIRRAATQGLEAMIMLSWFRETKLEGPATAKIKADSIPAADHHCQDGQHKLQMSRAPAANASVNQYPPTKPIPAENSRGSPHRVAEERNDEACKHVDTRRNAFDSPTRDHAVMSDLLAQRNEKQALPQTANANLTTSLSIEELAKARSSTPLHFDRPASPYVSSQRRGQRGLATAKVSLFDSRQVASNAKAPFQGFSNHTDNRLSMKAQAETIRRVPSLHVSKPASSNTRIAPREEELVCKFEQLVQFPSAAPSPPITLALAPANEHPDTARQPKQSLKSLRNFKISLRSAYKDSPPAPRNKVGNASSVTAVASHSSPQVRPASADSWQAMQCNVSDAIPGIARSSYIRALIPASQRPLSQVCSSTKTAVLPGMKLAGAIKPLNRIGRDQGHISVAAGSEEMEQGCRKLSLRSLWRVFMG
ncbi:hypothetical protein NDA11_007420 [Ustilago hordei]|uniref:Uncharacterized protein n=1 Tax=Ustilago hordei TaxID=120017 RepID=I2FN06_USTHO|nr:uncharacterized protein UHO2_05342 [Ustilago hordei]KAJ1039878.1 hypothetical protein NDA10_001448 [Ustilago hordei]KAJ1574103.1 hypothetical protein NDA12_004292 [Ustilago hordei]KAJ1574443.1 hypothetical protein NDA15_002517 [Ustilago hordei]KAJ1580461.1 hypothetical protein NDA11_007420 [Ustilago hordei]KAJ1599554.1 hypothetical protein NDA14_004693 [Ustilago hordei]